MTRLKEFYQRLADLPNFTMDLSTLVSPYRLVVWFTAVNLGLGFILFTTIATTRNSSEVAQLVAERGLGQFVAILIFLVLGAAFTVFIPIRTTGLILAPRFGRYMDQVVLSGISPLRYFIGRLFSVNVFALMLLVAVVPYFVLAISMGGVNFGFVIIGILALWVYANVLALATLAASLGNFELLSTPSVMVTFGWVYAAGALPIPVFPMALVTPSRLFVEPLFTGIRGVARGLDVYVGNVAIQIPSIFLFLTFYLVLAIVLVSWLITGPLNCIVLPNSTFGEVVMAGEKKKRSFFPRYLMFRRKSELCFLYENRSDWVAKRELFLRWGRTMFLVVGMILLAAVALHLSAHTMSPSEFTAAMLTVFLGSTLLSGAVFSHDRSTEKTLVRGGSLRVTAGAVSTGCFLCCMVIAALTSVVATVLRVEFQGELWLDASGESMDVIYSALYMLPLLTALIIHFYAFHRWLAMARWEFGRSTLLFIVYAGAILAVPLLPLGIFSEFPDRITEAYPGVETLLGAFAYLSPIPHFLLVLNPEVQFGDAIEMLSGSAPILTYIFHFAMAALFVSLAVKRHRSIDPWKNI